MRGWQVGPDDGPGGLLVCERCGRPLDDDPDDDPDGGPFGTPICGACARDRDEEVDLATLDSRDGSLDGIVEW